MQKESLPTWVEPSISFILSSARDQSAGLYNDGMLLPTIHGASAKKPAITVHCRQPCSSPGSKHATLFELLLPSSSEGRPRAPPTTRSRRTAAPPCLRVRACTVPPAEGILPAGLRAESLPRHVGVSPDGNSRWARARGMPTSAGHAALQPALEETVRLSRAWGIRVLTAFVFSQQNWDRPKEYTTTIYIHILLFLNWSLLSKHILTLLINCWNSQEEVDFCMAVYNRFIQDNVAQFVRYY